MAAMAEELLTKEGFLDKLSRGKGMSAILGANWKKRKFRLVGQKLSYFKILGTGEHEKKGELILANATLSAATAGKVNTETDFWAFMIHTVDGEEMTMKASSQKEKDEWIGILNKASKGSHETFEDPNAKAVAVADTDGGETTETDAGGEKHV